jgi:hypothetical protein
MLKKILESFGSGIPYAIGDRVELTEHEYENDERPFSYGHIFFIESINGRIFSLIDEKGNRLDVLGKHLEKLE